MQSFIDQQVSTTIASTRLSNSTIVTLFETWVDRFPGSIAVTGELGALTYIQVEQRANQIAHALCSAGVQRGEMVAVFLQRGPDLVYALLGVLKAGAVFVALDPRSPREALARVLSNVDCPFIWSRRSLVSGLPEISARILLFDEPGWIDSQPFTRLTLAASPDEAACVLFTSGSAGHSKAVLYLHRNLAARFSNTLQLSGFDRFSVFAQSSPVTSIDAIDEIFLPLVSGGSTAILPYETVTSPHQLIESLSAFQVTHILLVPSLLRVILAAEDSSAEKLAHLRTWMVGGEPLSASLARQFYQQIPGATLINFYGLTEGDACFHRVSLTAQYDIHVPVGCAVPGTSVYLLDDALKPVSDGEPGEICLSGDGLFHEYLNCPELNSQRWTPNPFAANGSDARLFHTGDLGRIRPDGEIEYLGRRDRMVKIRGFRVELGEVEIVLSQHPAVDQCVLVAKQPTGHDSTGTKHQTYMVAYVILKRGESVSSRDLRDFLKDHLPDHAIPAMVTVLDTFPLSPNGKIDVHALSRPAPLEREMCKTYVPARDPLELRLTKIWEELLDFSPIGVEDRFFEIGGDSLAAIDLMLRLEREFGCQLPIAALIQSPNIAGLAEVLRGKRRSSTGGSLVTIRATGSRPPLFCIHADGSVFIYRRFAEYLSPDIPIYGLQAHGLASPRDQPYGHIDEMAAHYIREIRTVQEEGPYHLCAFSAGGLIIFEMARQLHAQGEEVAFLGLLDAYGPDYPQQLSYRKQAHYKLSVHLNTLRLHGLRGRMTYLIGRMRHRGTQFSSQIFADLLIRIKVGMPHRIRYEYIARLIDQAAQTYPGGRTYPGEAVLFRAQTQPEGIQPERTLGWGNLVSGGLKIVEVTGTHNTIMRHEPHVEALVREIECQLSGLWKPVLS